MSTIVPVVLSGGSGTRLWPLSRAMYPKQFINFFNGQGSTFLGAALSRLKLDAGFAAPILLCNNEHRFLVKEEVEKARIEPKAIILEPVARNTAAAIAIAALATVHENPNGILAVMPSDHVVRDEARSVLLRGYNPYFKVDQFNGGGSHDTPRLIEQNYNPPIAGYRANDETKAMWRSTGKLVVRR